MSTRSGPYAVRTPDGKEWRYEHDFAYCDLLAEGEGDVFRIWAPDASWAMEIALWAFDEVAMEADPLPRELIADIRARFDLPVSLALEHARLHHRGQGCPHCENPPPRTAPLLPR